MEFVFTQEHHELRAAVRNLLDERAPLARNRELGETGAWHDPDLYRDLAAMGLPGLVLPEALGGSGGSLVDLAIVCDELGAVLLGGPFFSSAILAGQALLACPDDPVVAELAPAVADGKTTVAVVDAIAGVRAERAAGRPLLTGSAEIVSDGAEADRLLVLAGGADGPTLLLAEPGSAGLLRQPLDGLDLTRTLARVRFDATPARQIGDAGAGARALRRVRRVGAAMLAAQQVGGLRRCLEMTTRHVAERVQFGRPVGAFQAVKHRLADVACRLELAESAAYWAAWRCAARYSAEVRADPGDPAGEVDPEAHPESDVDEAVAVAGAYCGEAFLRTAADTIQLHGGLGFTWEHDAHLFLRRARTDLSLLGPSRRHRERLADLLSGAAERNAA